MLPHLRAGDIQRGGRGWATRRQLLGSSWAGAPRLACTVQALLLEALYEALKHEREVYGTVCKDAPSLFAAVDRRGVGALKRARGHGPQPLTNLRLHRIGGRRGSM